MQPRRRTGVGIGVATLALPEGSPEAAERFGALMRARALEGATPARKAWIGAIVDRIEVDQGTIRIMGRKDVLEQAIASGGVLTPGVRTCIPKWRAGQDESANTYAVEMVL